MYGRLEAYGRRACGCCDLGPDKAKARRLENRQWRREWEQDAEPMGAWTGRLKTTEAEAA